MLIVEELDEEDEEDEDDVGDDELYLTMGVRALSTGVIVVGVLRVSGVVAGSGRPTNGPVELVKAGLLTLLAFISVFAVLMEKTFAEELFQLDRFPAVKSDSNFIDWYLAINRSRADKYLKFHFQWHLAVSDDLHLISLSWLSRIPLT